MRTSKCLLVAIGTWLAGSTLGCDRVVRELAREVVEHAAPVVKTEPVTVVSDAEAQRFAADLLGAIQGGDVERTASLFDFSALAHRCLAGLNLFDKSLQEVARGLESGSKRTGLVRELAQSVANGGRMRLLRTYKEGEGAWITFRILPPSGGVEHYTCLLTKHADGKVAAVDVHTLTTGELMSVQMRRVLMSGLLKDKDIVSRLTDQESAIVKYRDDIRQAQDAYTAGRYLEAADRLEKLPATLRDQKFVLLTRVRATALIDDSARYQRTLEELLRRYPKDPAAAVASIDYFYLLKQYDKALNAIAVIERQTAPDAYFAVLRANTLVEAGRPLEAIKAAQAAIEREPELKDAYLTLIVATLKSKDFAATGEAMLRLRDTFHETYEFKSVPEYAEFEKSREYLAFQRGGVPTP